LSNIEQGTRNAEIRSFRYVILPTENYQKPTHLAISEKKEKRE